MHLALLTSRAEARLHLGRYAAAIEDCEAALALDGTHEKTLSRLQRARSGLGYGPSPPPPPLHTDEDLGERGARHAFAFCSAVAAVLDDRAADRSALGEEAADELIPLTEPVSQADGWAKAISLAYEVRWRSALAADVLGKSGLRKAKLREACSGYSPLLFSISLFETAPGAKSFAYYAAATVAFVADKVAEFGGCEFQLHLNAGATSHVGLLRRLHEVARGRIRFVEFAFTPRPRIAPWLLAAMRLAPLLSVRARTVVTADIHDDLQLQNAQVRSLLSRLRRQGGELCLTWWLAEDGAEECLLNCALPVDNLKRHVTDRFYHSAASCGGVALHAHMDAGLMIATGEQLRSAILRAHKGETFIEYLKEMVLGAPTIPHGIEEMAWDSYLSDVGWSKLTPRVLFSVHRSLLAGRDSKDPFKHVVASSDVPHALRLRKEEVDVGKAEFGITLPTCRHSQALDCAEDSLAWMKREKLGVGRCPSC